MNNHTQVVLKPLDEVIKAVSDGIIVASDLDNRSLYRIVEFIPSERFGELNRGLQLVEGRTHQVSLYDPVIVLARLGADIDFAFVKALTRRGLSSSAMVDVIRMWLFVLNDHELYSFANEEKNYPMYGLPIFKAVALKYGFDNPIGLDSGTEHYYEDD